MNSARHGFVDMHVAASIPRGGGGQSEAYRRGGKSEFGAGVRVQGALAPIQTLSRRSQTRTRERARSCEDTVGGVRVSLGLHTHT